MQEVTAEATTVSTQTDDHSGRGNNPIMRSADDILKGSASKQRRSETTTTSEPAQPKPQPAKEDDPTVTGTPPSHTQHPYNASAAMKEAEALASGKFYQKFEAGSPEAASDSGARDPATTAPSAAVPPEPSAGSPLQAQAQDSPEPQDLLAPHNWPVPLDPSVAPAPASLIAATPASASGSAPAPADGAPISRPSGESTVDSPVAGKSQGPVDGISALLRAGNRASNPRSGNGGGVGAVGEPAESPVATGYEELQGPAESPQLAPGPEAASAESPEDVYDYGLSWDGGGDSTADAGNSIFDSSDWGAGVAEAPVDTAGAGGVEANIAALQRLQREQDAEEMNFDGLSPQGAVFRDGGPFSGGAAATGPGEDYGDYIADEPEEEEGPAGDSGRGGAVVLQDDLQGTLGDEEAIGADGQGGDSRGGVRLGLPQGGGIGPDGRWAAQEDEALPDATDGGGTDGAAGDVHGAGRLRGGPAGGDGAGLHGGFAEDVTADRSDELDDGAADADLEDDENPALAVIEDDPLVIAAAGDSAGGVADDEELSGAQPCCQSEAMLDSDVAFVCGEPGPLAPESGLPPRVPCVQRGGCRRSW